ncbi:hypothetical protein GUJ93_ZPchr0006g45275 [Zizania palustris]|uniref:Uncharacterized protein n=1 Tax=Zizania palustris TaxID=103762 RepID=A0A8J5SC46_ZIZPA|nr:hypothetical protein GUJ93_ZPchr0006g45275 [Zizania palustris]
MLEKYKVCKDCGVTIFEGLDALVIKDSTDIEYPSLAAEGDNRSPNPDTLAQDTVLANSGGHLSLLQKCSRIFKFSPRKKPEQSSEQQAGKNTDFGTRLEEASQSDDDYEPTPVYQVAHDSFNAEELPSESGALENEESERQDIAADVQMESSFGIADNCVDIHGTQSFDGTTDMAVDTAIATVDQNGKDSVVLPEVDFEPETSKQGRRQQNRKGRAKGVKRTQSVRAVVEDAKGILGENFEEKNGQGDLGGTRKRRLVAGSTISEQDDDSEAHSESVSLGGQRRKRRQTAAVVVTQAPGEKRYNLRRTTVANAATAAQTHKKKAVKTGNKQTVEATTADDTEGTSKAEEPAVGSKGGSRSVDGTSQLHDFALAEAGGDAHGPAEITGEGDGDIADSKDALPDVMPMTPSGSELGAEHDDEDDGDSERRNQSIGKKLWSFFTT